MLLALNVLVTIRGRILKGGFARAQVKLNNFPEVKLRHTGAGFSITAKQECSVAYTSTCATQESVPK